MGIKLGFSLTGHDIVRWDVSGWKS